MSDRRAPPLQRISTGSLERRLHLTRSGLLAGTRYVAKAAGALLAPRAEREAHGLHRKRGVERVAVPHHGGDASDHAVEIEHDGVGEGFGCRHGGSVRQPVTSRCNDRSIGS